MSYPVLHGVIFFYRDHSWTNIFRGPQTKFGEGKVTLSYTLSYPVLHGEIIFKDSGITQMEKMKKCCIICSCQRNHQLKVPPVEQLIGKYQLEFLFVVQVQLQ